MHHTKHGTHGQWDWWVPTDNHAAQVGQHIRLSTHIPSTLLSAGRWLPSLREEPYLLTETLSFSLNVLFAIWKSMSSTISVTFYHWSQCRNNRLVTDLSAWKSTGRQFKPTQIHLIFTLGLPEVWKKKKKRALCFIPPMDCWKDFAGILSLRVTSAGSKGLGT